MGIYSLVDNRADHSLHVIAKDLEKHYKIQNRNYNKIELSGEKLGLSKLYTSYKILNKWMGRIYIFGIYGVINCPLEGENFTVKLNYKGKIGKEEPLFQSKDNSLLAETLNHDKELMEISKELDFEKLVIKYSKDNKSCQIEIWPNFGDFIWMLIPPLRYMRRPSSKEIENINKLLKKLTYIIKTYQE